MKTFHTRLAEAIRRAGISKSALADAMGVPASSVSRWLGSSVPRSETIAGIAKVLGVDANWLLSGPVPASEVKIASSVVREEFQAPPLARDPGELSLMDRIKKLESERENLIAGLEDAHKKLDALMDLLGGKVEP